MEPDPPPADAPTRSAEPVVPADLAALVAAVEQVEADPFALLATLAPQLPAIRDALRRLQTRESDFASALEREKLAAIRELAYGASHEINNPLANISTRAQALLREERDAERRRKLAVIVSQAFRAHEMIAGLMLFAKPPALTCAATDGAEIVAAVLEELRDDAQRQGAALGSIAAAPAPLWGDRARLVQALKALAQNALEAVGPGGRIEVGAEIRPAAPAAESLAAEGRAAAGPRAALFVRDDGPGVPPEIRPRLFDPYFSGREAGRGLGLGLCVAWRIAELHGGTIQVGAAAGGGAEFTLLLPTTGGPERVEQNSF